MASYTFSYTHSAVTFDVTGLSSGDNVTFFVRHTSNASNMLVDATHNGGLVTAMGSSLTKTFEVLDMDDPSYTINVLVNGGAAIKSNSFTLQRASYTARGVREGIEFTVSGLYSGDKVEFYGRYNESGSSATVINWQGGTAFSSTMSRTFYDIPGGHDYAVNVRLNWQIRNGAEYTYLLGTSTVTVASGRPENWSWISTVEKGKPISISANEWNSFTGRVNAFRRYKGLPDYGAFVVPTSGTLISATIVNHVVWAINAMGSSYGRLDTVNPGDAITASFFNGLKNALNAVT